MCARCWVLCHGDTTGSACRAHGRAAAAPNAMRGAGMTVAQPQVSGVGGQCVADRLLYSKGATLTGKLLLNGETPPNDYRSRCAFVQQVEVFYPYSTVRETVEMAARMRLGRTM